MALPGAEVLVIVVDIIDKVEKVKNDPDALSQMNAALENVVRVGRGE
jgi:hypothetical protein